jgi:hypothetical protein
VGVNPGNTKFKMGRGILMRGRVDYVVFDEGTYDYLNMHMRREDIAYITLGRYSGTNFLNPGRHAGGKRSRIFISRKNY